MTDENDINAAAEITSEDATKAVQEPKKRRAPRRSKAEIEAASVKSPKVRAKRGTKDIAAASAVETSIAGKATRKAKLAAAAETVKTIVGSGDEIADLMQLEEENKGLRKALAEKLRAENEDLRKRLG